MAGQPSVDHSQTTFYDRVQQEIINRQLMEDALWKTARRFQALIEKSNDIVLILDIDGHFRYTTPSTKRILGYASEDLIGRTIYEITLPDDRPLLGTTFKQALDHPGKGMPEIEHGIRHKDGLWLTFAATITNLFNLPMVEGYLVNCHDVTQHKQAEKLLRENEKRFRQVITSISDHIYVTELDDTGRHTNRYLSPNIETLTGYSQKKFMEDRFFWTTRVIHPSDRDAAEEQAAQLDAGHHSEMEYRLVKADGEIIWVRDSGAVYQEGDKKIIYGVVSDVTKRKRLERQLSQSKKMEAVGRLAGGVAHDFNNLLTTIIGNCEMALDTINPDNPLYQDILKIRRAGERAADLTKQLLAFSRNQTLQPEVINLNSVVNEAKGKITNLLNEKINLAITLDSNIYRIKADPDQLEQVILNLVINARDAMPQGGQLTVETTNVELDETNSAQQVDIKPGSYARLTISDTGHSMDDSVKARIFEPFFTTKEQGAGTGLGLAAVYGIIKESNGHITAAGSPEEGTTFKIYLPQIEDV